MKFTRRAFTATAAAALAANPLYAANGTLQIVATTGMIADAARQIGGDMAEVRGLLGPGVDPHAYRQTRSDIAAMVGADLVLWHGLYLEAQMEDFLADLATRTKVVAVAEALPKDALLTHDSYQDRFDPHVWMAPLLWSRVVSHISDTMKQADPENAVRYGLNHAQFQIELLRLIEYSEDVLASVPENARVLLSAHDAFGYFGAAYGYEVIGIQGISTQSEAGLNRIGELVDLLVSRKIGAVFVESSVSDRNIRALIEGAAAQGHEVRIGGELFSDAMGPAGSYEGTYLGMIDHNVTTIARALGGQAPERGMDGKLAGGA